MKCLLLTAILLISLAAASPKWHQLEGYTFSQYVKDFRRAYKKGTEEYEKRESVFNAKLSEIKKHNADAEMTWKRGVNQFTDMTAEEWRRYNRAFKSEKRSKPMEVHMAPKGAGPSLPKTVDYRTWTSPRVLTAVKHQGSCGNCWVHAATETIEAYYALLTNQLPVFGTQQLTSCVTECYGCDGGDATLAYDYLNKSGTRGLTEEWAYPFVDFFFNISNPNATTTACKNISTEYPSTPYTWFAELNEAGIRGYGSVIPNDAESTMHALATIGPLSISVAAGNWQDYETGVMGNTAKYGNFSEWGIDHAVQMVGYGHDKELGKDYWIVRNSWGTLWGEEGFVRLDRPKVEPCSPKDFGPVCGVSGCLNDPHYPFVTDRRPIDY